MSDESPPSLTPNDLYRRVRRLFLGAVATAILTFVLALQASIHNIGYGVLPAVLMIAGVCLLVLAMLARASARCPTCSASLMWRSGPFGTGRISLGVKPKCPSCGLDLDKPWQPPTEEMAETPKG